MLATILSSLQLNVLQHFHELLWLLLMFYLKYIAHLIRYLIYKELIYRSKKDLKEDSKSPKYVNQEITVTSMIRCSMSGFAQLSLPTVMDTFR